MNYNVMDTKILPGLKKKKKNNRFFNIFLVTAGKISTKENCQRLNYFL